jgi:uncharacterized protein (TIGR02996 family)
MTADDAFLADIIANPDDDVLRLIYADYLDEHGQPDRASFIRVQIGLATLPLTDPRRPVLTTTERLLLEKHERQWAGPLAERALDWGFHRGFIEFIYCTASTLVKHGDTLFRSVPVRDLQLAFGEYVDVSQLGDEGLIRLLASPHLSGLQRLGLAHMGIGVDGMRALACWRPLAGLTRLDLSHNLLGDEAFQLFLVSPHLGSLQYVSFWGNPVSYPMREMLIQRFGQQVSNYSPETDDDTPDE